MGSEGVRAVVDPSWPTTELKDKTLRRITNLHMVTAPGWQHWVIKQCIGELSGGAPTIVELPVKELPRVGTLRALYTAFTGEKRFAQIMGFPECVSREW